LTSDIIGNRSIPKQRQSASNLQLRAEIGIQNLPGGRHLSGGAWLKLLVLGVVYYFGIKQGIGAESLSEFLKAMRMNRHVGCSATALRSLKHAYEGGYS